jgi:succinyl-CoA synthetase alpha subunit
VSIIVGPDVRVAIHGITGKAGLWSLRDLRSYGTRVVAGVVPGRGGTEVEEVPIFDFAREAVTNVGATASLVYVPPRAAGEAVAEALEAGIKLVVYPGDGLPVKDAIRLRRLARDLGGTLIGPNSPGLISPGKAKLGFMPSYCYCAGPLGVISKSGSLSYEICWRLTRAGIGQSSVVGVGGDPVKGLTMIEALDLFHDDPETKAILVLGEVGGGDEYQACDYVHRAGAKPVAAFVVGRSAPRGRKLGHASAFIGSDREGYDAKISGLDGAGVTVARSLLEIVAVVRSVLGTARDDA